MRARAPALARASQLTFLYIVVPWKQLNFALYSDTLIKNKIFSLASLCLQCVRLCDLTLWTAIATQCTSKWYEMKRNLCTNIGVTLRAHALVQRIYFVAQSIWNISKFDSEKSNKIKSRNSHKNCSFRKWKLFVFRLNNDHYGGTNAIFN